MKNKLILIPDSFKGSLSSAQICGIIRAVASEECPQYECVSIPVADGGEGTVDAFLTAVGGQKVPLTVTGPLGMQLASFYGRLNERTAVIEMAAAAGLPQVGNARDPEKTTTFGVGELMRDAIAHGAKEIILGLGGSATNDGGCGAAAALGVRFYDNVGNSFVPVGGTLSRIARIDCAPARKLMQNVSLRVMCDIDNPLCGKTGAAAVFGPQKGANEAMVRRLDEGLHHLAAVLARDAGRDILELPGSGAAGGMGGGMAAMLGGQMQMGIEAVLDLTHFDALLPDTALVITGEGQIDSQSLRGKCVIGVAGRCLKQQVPCVSLVGGAKGDMKGAYEKGVTGVFCVCPHPMTLEDAMRTAEANLAFTARNVLRLFTAGCREH